MKRIKVVSIILSVALLWSAMSLSASAEGETAVLGDINGSGKVDTQDAREILKMACRIIPVDLTVADMNGDGNVSVADAVAALKAASQVGGVVIPDKNGENVLTDDATNEFIKIVVSKYNINSKALVAIYSVPDSGTNYVLQFKSKNNYEKSPDNLERVYHIGAAPERKLSYTEGKLLTGNYNCEGAEGKLVFELVKTQVMPQYPTYFKGV